MRYEFLRPATNIERMLLLSDRISDLNFSVGQLPQIEINGKLTPVQPLGMQKLNHIRLKSSL